MRRHSARPAIKSNSVAWSYSELDAVSSACAAAFLRECGEEPAPIALLMNHDATLVAAIAGVLRSGCFYLVLNTAHPRARLSQILEETKPKATVADLSHLALARDLSRHTGKVFSFDEINRSTKGAMGRPAPGLDSPCAIFYTSGSSNRPRPFVYTHGGTLTNIDNYARALAITPEDRLALLSHCSAAASVSQIFGALLHGACLLPLEPMIGGFNDLRRWIDKEKITVLHSVPSLFRRFAESLSPGEQIESVRAIKLGGEPMFSSDVDLFRQHFRSETILINGLGLTEANGNVCHFRVTHDTAIASATVPVGQALPGIEIKLFGDNDEEVPASKVGEISLRGKYLSPGIWNGSKIDKRQHGEWLRTGDLGRSDAQGNYEHLGRKDDRLKLRGHWVCPAEIESALMEIPMVREAAVVPIKSRQRETTIAAFTTSRNSAPSEEELRARLREKLPSHLLPNRFFSLADMPLLPSGKVNRQQLVQRAAANSEVSSRYDSTDTIELQLVRIWESVLRIECVTADDDFFAVGGDSLAAAALFAAVEKFFNVDLPVSTLLQAPTIKLLAKAIRMRGPSVVDLRLVALQLGGSNPPLYCVPGADSAAISLRHLARRLGPEQPFFAFQPRGLDGRPPYLRTVEQMAADYLDVLRQHQPRGPYCLCGTSFGGVVAFEMACSLIAQGERVSFLGLLDTYGGDYPRPRRDLSLRKKIKVAMRRSRAGATKTFSEWWQRLLVRLDLKFGFRPLPRPHAQRYLYLQEICFAARRHYSLRPFNGRIHLFRLEAQPSATLYELDPFLGWRGAATGGIEVHEVPGRHGFHLREPNVGDLAKKLARCLSHAKGARLEFEPCIKC